MPRLLILTYIPSPYQVELFNAIAASQLFELKVAYLYGKSDTAIAKLWQQSNLQHDYLILDDCEAVYQQLEAEIPHVDLFVFNYYAHPRVGKLIDRCIVNHVPWCFWGERPGFKHDNWLGYLYRRGKLSKLHTSQAAIWGVGSWGVDRYRREFGSNRQYVNFPYFSDLTRFQEKKKPVSYSRTTRTFLYSGALIKRKGVDLLATAFARLAAEFPYIRLHLVGEGELKPELTAKLAKYQDRVQFFGFQTWEKLPEYYQQADILCAPSRHDGWALVVPEGLAAGLPVIATKRTGAALDLIENDRNGWIIPTDDAEALYKVMKRSVLLSAEELNNYSQTAIHSVTQHSLTDGVNKFHQAVKQTLAITN